MDIASEPLPVPVPVALPVRPAPPLAHLRIHSGPPARATAPEAGGWLSRGLAWLGHRWPRREAMPVCLSIDDSRGHCVLDLNDPAPLLDVPLAAGTYHVTVRQAGGTRRYTLTLAPASTVDLQVRGPSR